MKIRSGFVSNSSSSSFIIIGTMQPDTIQRMLDKAGIVADEDGYFADAWGGMLEHKFATFIITNDQVSMAGIEGDRLKSILNNVSIKEAKTIIAKMLSEDFGLEINESELFFDYGETSSE